MDINLRNLAKMAARRICEKSALYKALDTRNKGGESDQQRREELVNGIAKEIEETFRPYSNEAFQ